MRSVASIAITRCPGRGSLAGSTALFSATNAIVQLLPSKRGATASIGCTHTRSPQSAGGRSTACSAKKPSGSSVSGDGTSPSATIARNSPMSCAPPCPTPTEPVAGGGCSPEEPRHRCASSPSPQASASKDERTSIFLRITEPPSSSAKRITTSIWVTGLRAAGVAPGRRDHDVLGARDQAPDRCAPPVARDERRADARPRAPARTMPRPAPRTRRRTTRSAHAEVDVVERDREARDRARSLRPSPEQQGRPAVGPEPDEPLGRHALTADRVAGLEGHEVPRHAQEDAVGSPDASTGSSVELGAAVDEQRARDSTVQAPVVRARRESLYAIPLARLLAARWPPATRARAAARCR